jgi:hypothetical protein
MLRRQEVSPAGASAERVDARVKVADAGGLLSGGLGRSAGLLEVNPGLEAKTIFEYLQRRYAGRFADGQLRTLQRRVKVWRATEGPVKEVFFAQRHHPGRLSASDFTHMSELGITIQGQSFPHLIYHLVLTYSNWESATVCFSESAWAMVDVVLRETQQQCLVFENRAIRAMVKSQMPIRDRAA